MLSHPPPSQPLGQMKGLLGTRATTPLSHPQGGIPPGGHPQTGLDNEHMEIMGVFVSPSPTFVH